VILKHHVTKEDVEIKNGKELKEFLSYLNPLFLKEYKRIIERDRKDIEIIGIGTEIKIIKKYKERN